MSSNKLVIKPLRGEDGHQTFSVRMKTGLLEKIEKIATETGYSRNALISMFAEYAMENCEIQLIEERGGESKID